MKRGLGEAKSRKQEIADLGNLEKKGITRLGSLDDRRVGPSTLRSQQRAGDGEGASCCGAAGEDSCGSAEKERGNRVEESSGM